MAVGRDTGPGNETPATGEPTRADAVGDHIANAVAPVLRQRRFVRRTPAIIDIGEALRDSDPARRLTAHALDVLTRAVPAAFATFTAVDARSRPVLTVALTSEQLDASMSKLYAEYRLHYERSDPFAVTRFGATSITAVTVDDLGGEAALARTPYGQFARRLGIGPQLALFLRDQGRIVSAIRLARREGEPQFGPRDVGFARRAVPLLELSFAGYALTRAAGSADDTFLPRHGLTPRQADVARLAAGGSTNAEVARALVLSESTVKTHLNAVFAKLGVRTRTELALLLRS